MKKNIHPKYQQVLFVDSSTGHKFVCGSTLQSEETEVFKGVKYPVYRVSVSSASHPFFTGSKQLVDAEGRVDKFKKRYIAAQGKNKGSEEQSQEQPKEQPEQPAQGKKGKRK